MSLVLARSKSRHTRRRGVEKADLVEAAASAQLRYVSDDRPGIRRLRRGKGFRYLDAEGHPVRDLVTLRRIKALAIAPAWTDVWIFKHELADGVAAVARHLGNTVAICRRCYIHSAVIAAHAEDALPALFERPPTETSSGLSGLETAVLRLLGAGS